jgi:kynurenine formamidase
MPLIDLSHSITDGMVTYPGIPAPQITAHLTFEGSADHYAEGTEFQIGLMTLAANTGTYLDTPAHRFREGHDLTGLPLERCADLPVTVVRCRGLSGRAIDHAALQETDVAGHAVLFDTGWDIHWGTPGYSSGAHPYLTEELAGTLVERGAALVGIDSLNIDAADDGTRPIHTALLRADVPIVEHLCNLDAVPDAGATFFAVPPRIEAMATFPVRAFVVV